VKATPVWHYIGGDRVAVTYHVGPHDGAFGYRLGDVWSDTYPDHDASLAAAKSAAKRQHLEGSDAEIAFQLADGADARSSK
jgi:hypothetical protein